jgi:tetratricopeptide (TPR) repeat protein
MAAQMRRQSRSEQEPARRRWYALAQPQWAVAVAVIALLALAVQWAGLLVPSPTRLLARAFASNRTLPIRFPDAQYAPLVAVTRTAQSTSIDLAEAEAMIGRGLARSASSAKWLQLRGRLDILRYRYDSAIAELRPLADSPSPSAAVCADLGIAYWARGAAGKTPADFGEAVKYLSQAIGLAPNSPVTLFNRAVALESLYMWDRAEEDWKAYLGVDSTSGWAAEARNHLRQIQEKKTSGASK